jgi:2-dehydro-3-deoxyphosphogluconate aldolase/(4S)-4-hydroxy-2-oxoglutarate aldolase
MSKEIEKIMSDLKIVPVIKITDVKDTLPLMDALIAGGLPIAEITFRTDAAPEAIALVAKERPDMVVGAGTVLTLEQAQKAVDAGASFIVAPGFNPELVDWCLERNIPIVPGVNSPSQMEEGLRKGLKIMKFFPAEASGGVAMLKAVGSVYPIKFMPTGGVTPQNIKEYLSLPNVICCGGTWMVNNDLIKAGKFSEIAQLTREALELVK